MASLRIVFMGTPDLAATCLNALLNSRELEILAAVSQPDRPKGRHLKFQPTPVKSVALASGIPLLQPEKAREPEFLNRLKEMNPDLIAVAAYGQILPKALLDLPTHGCLNVHTSLLPRYRGAAPIQWAILNGDSQTGVTIMKIVPELDAGDIVSQESTPITPDDDAISLHDRLAEMGANLLVNTIPRYVSGEIQPKQQLPGGVVYARKINKNDGLVNWSNTANHIANRVRGLVPWPTAHTHLLPGAKPVMIKLWRAQAESASGQAGTILESNADGIQVGCGSGSLRILELQPEGKRRMSVREFLSGHRIKPGDRFIRE